MSNLKEVRKSGRQRVPNRKYVDNEVSFRELNNFLSEDDSEAEGERESLRKDSIAEKDFEFSLESTGQDLDEEPADSDSTVNASDGSGIVTPIEDVERLHSYSREAFSAHRQSLNTKRNQFTATDSSSRSRGLIEQQVKYRDNRINLLAGPEEDEAIALDYTRAQWANDPCLPKRAQMRHAFAHTEEQRTMEAVEGWDWYFDQNGKEHFAEKQKEANLNVERRAEYLTGSDQNLLMGPYGHQKLFNLPRLQSIPIDHLPEDSGVDSVEEVDANQSTSRKRRRRGWMINVGSKLQCLDWAPNHNNGSQYLALASSLSSKESKNETFKTAPAFTPSQSTPSSVQIWAFSTTDPSQTTGSTLDVETAPILKQILCSDWGDAKQLKWCPMPKKERPQQKSEKTDIGLLAGIWGDGYARVLDVQLKDQVENTTSHVKIDSVAFAARPANVICTCVCWLSPTDLAIGHSDGSIAVYDIHPGTNNDNTTTTAPSPTSANTNTAPALPTPYLTIPDPRSMFTPILTLSSAHPTHPTLLTTTSISGHERLLDLRAPMTDYVLGVRTRSPPTNQVYSPHLLSFVFNDESDGTIRATGLRCWGIDRVALARKNSSIGGGGGGGASAKDAKGVDRGGTGPLGRECLDVGKVHASVAFGTADGSVIVCNPVVLVLGSRRGKREIWQMCVCRLEWVRVGAALLSAGEAARVASSNGEVDVGVAADADEDIVMADAAGEAKRPNSKGISRITHAYKAEKLDFVAGKTEKPAYATIFEEENAVTAVKWNPNIRCGGWLAVGWGCGLVRVEDVAI